MIISILDASYYFKGLLLLARKDNSISNKEHELMLRIGKQFGFEKEFCENTIHEVLDNTYIIDSPPVFSSKELAQKFLKDGLAVAASDKEFHPREERWLLAVAQTNNIERDWFIQIKHEFLNRDGGGVLLEADNLTTQHSLTL